MYAEITSALAGIKTFTEFTKLILQAKVDAAVKQKAIESQSAIIDLQSTLMGLQSEYQSLLREKDEVERRLIEIEDWKSEALKYELKQVSTGAFVYVLKHDEDSATPTHWLCPRCYEERQKSILQRAGYIQHLGYKYFCLRCKGDIWVKQ